MRKYRWPGNVRELRNVLERALVTCTGEALGKENLGRDFGKGAVSGTDDSLRLQAGMTVADAERREVASAIAWQASLWRADLIVLTRRPRLAASGLVMRCASDQVMRQANCAMVSITS